MLPQLGDLTRKVKRAMTTNGHVNWERVATATLALLVTLLGVLWGLAQLQVSELKVRVAQLEGWKDGIGPRVSVLEEKARGIDEVKADIKEMKKDVSELLRLRQK